MTILMALIQGFFMFMMRQTIIVMSRLIEYDQKNDLYSHYQKLHLEFYKHHNTGDLMTRISEDIGKVRMYTGPSIMYIVNTIMTLIFTIGIMIKVNISLTLLVLLPLPLLALTTFFVSAIINRKGTIVQEKLSEISTLSQESFSGIRIIKSFGKEKEWIKSFSRANSEYTMKSLSLILTNSLFQPSTLLLIGLSTITTIYIGGNQVIEGKVSVGNIAEFIVYVNRLTWPIVSLGWVTSLIQRAASSQKRIDEFLNTIPLINPSGNQFSEFKKKIEFKNVSFKYQDSSNYVLRNVSFEIPKGKTIAIIGRTGAGKSTIANLLCRLYEVDSGEILIDNQSIKSIKLDELRKNISYSPQETFLFSDTIAQNVAFGDFLDGSTDLSSIERIKNSLKSAEIHESIEALPQKFNSVLGERGINLSGGQRQRIAIARSLYKNAPILILDDSLSAIDTVTENKIISNISNLSNQKTIVLISHRISTVKNAHTIYVLDNSTIAEHGSHNFLLEKKGVYFKMYCQQQQNENVDDFEV